MARVLFFLLIVWFVISPVAGHAVSAEKAYDSARAAYRSLLDSTKKQRYRDQWETVISAFNQVAEQHATHRRAADSTFMAAKCYEGLYDVSRLRRDARRAIETYMQVSVRYPRSRLADDALLAAAEIEEKTFSDDVAAALLVEQLLEQFPKGDMALEAKKMLGHLRPSSSVSSTPPAVSLPTPVKPTTPQSVTDTLANIRFWSNPGYTRVVLDLGANISYSANFLAANPKEGAPARIYVDLLGVRPGETLADSTKVDDGLLRRIRTGRPAPDRTRVVLDLVSLDDYKVFPLEDPYRLVIDIAAEPKQETVASAPKTSLAVPPPSAVTTPIPASASDEISALLDQGNDEVRLPNFHLPEVSEDGQLRRIVVDAGHGGKDPGAVGPSGVREKDVVLQMALMLAKKLEKEFKCEVILTRDGDVFLPLEERTAIANKVGADLFISVHANANNSSKAYGIETYYLNFSKNDKAAAVAARENNTSLQQVSALERILFDLMAHAKINESSRLASEIQKSLVVDLSKHYRKVRDLGVRQGPFYVLLGATMPSVLVEVAFISNREEEKRLKDRKYQDKATQAIVRGVRNYAKALKLMAGR
ncbi:MAG: N-acetylmuramoyl-L-alanine amidase [Desulfuromonas sp.]|nr:MAG: N-acetylmuramoyl-L-alanine amidase [Desulfuromonas sp.]